MAGENQVSVVLAGAVVVLSDFKRESKRCGQVSEMCYRRRL